MSPALRACSGRDHLSRTCVQEKTVHRSVGSLCVGELTCLNQVALGGLYQYFSPTKNPMKTPEHMLSYISFIFSALDHMLGYLDRMPTALKQ